MHIAPQSEVRSLRIIWEGDENSLKSRHKIVAKRGAAFTIMVFSGVLELKVELH